MGVVVVLSVIGKRVREEVGRSGNVAEGSSFPNREVRDDGSRRNECSAPDTAASFARRAENPSDSGRARRVHGPVTNSGKNFPVAVIGVTISSTWQENSTTK